MSSNTPLHPVVAKLHHIESELNRYLIGRSEEIHGSLLALAARQHVFLLGAPGSAKSMLALEVARRVRGAEFFRIDLHAFTMREEIFGPISLAALRERDALERKTAGFLPAAHIAQLDEIWKCPPATLNTLLSILNEREFRNDDELLRAPLISALVTSNEIPPADRTLDALYDRILLRYQVAPLHDTADRRRAAELSLSYRAFESEARRVAAEIRGSRENLVATALLRREGAAQTLSGEALDSEAPEATLVAAAGLHLSRPERWLIDRYGEIFSTLEERERFREGHYPSADLPIEADRAELLRRMVDWADEREVWLPYETFLSLSDLETLNGLVLSMKMPESVEDSFYRILDFLGGVSVRRETELRTLVAAEAVNAGHALVAADDLSVMVHALWDRPEQIADARRAVEKESGNLAREIEALKATLAEWRGQAEDPRSVSEGLNFRAQMDQDIARFTLIAEGFPDNEELAASLAEAKHFRDEFNAKLFLSGPIGPEPEAGSDVAIQLPGGSTPPDRPGGARR